MIKEFIIKLLEKKGFVSKWSLPSILVSQKVKFELIYILLFALQKKHYKIIQIGANDGVHADPINSFIEKYNKSISYIGFEPQKGPFEKLKSIYQSYENFHLINECVGREAKANFYYTTDAYTDLCKKNNWGYSDGTNSLIESNVSKRLLRNNVDPKKYIDSFEVDVLPLKKSIEKYDKNLIEQFKNIDLLQIDTEGYDDQVIYHSNLEFFKPRYINFEYKNLTETKLENLTKYLNENSYECLRWKNNDCLAVFSGNYPGI